MKEIGSNIKKIRELRNFSQQALSLEIGISQKQLSRIENNMVSPTVQLLVKICNELNVGMNELMQFNVKDFLEAQHVSTKASATKSEMAKIEQLYEKLLAEKERSICILQERLHIIQGNLKST